MKLVAHEIQALIKHHAETIVACVEDGGIKPSQQEDLVKTCRRMTLLAKTLGTMPVQ